MTGPDRPESDSPDASADSVTSRANLLSEEEAAGSDDPERQAAVILEESEARVLRGTVESGGIERRRSEDTVAPEDRGDA